MHISIFQSGNRTNEPDNHNHIPNYLWKNDRFLSIYKEKVTSSIQLLDPNIGNLETDLQNFNSLLLRCASESYSQFSKGHFRFPTKKWWNQDLTRARSTLSQMFNIWRDKKFPRDPDDVSFQRYLFARKRFRTLVKRYKNQSNVEHYINIDKLQHTDPKSYWKKVRLNSNSTQKLFTINDKTKTSEIASEFHDHFRYLLNNPRTPNGLFQKKIIHGGWRI